MGKRQRRVSFASEVTEFAEISEPQEQEVTPDSVSESEASDDEESEPQPKRRRAPQIQASSLALARETAEVFKSNIFKLQTDELLKELAIKSSHVVIIEKVLHRLHEVIQAVPESEEMTVAQAEAFSNMVKVPWPDPKPSTTNYTFQYKAPKSVDLVGSFGLKTGSNLSKSIDLCVTMPEELFQAKDCLNYRALYKRCVYVAWLAHHLAKLTRKHKLPVKISYSYVNGDVLNPGLKIESVTTDDEDDLHFSKTKMHLQLIVAFPQHIFDAKKLLPDKNCIRIQADNAGDLPPTPIYNSSVLSSTLPSHYLRYLYTIKKQCDGFKDAILLGRTWLAKRGFSGAIGDGGFGHFEWSVLMTSLLQGGSADGSKQLLHGFSSYQLFKGTIKYLAEIDLGEDGHLSFTSDIGSTTSSKWKEEGFRIPTIFDKFTKLNVLWKMTPDSYSALKHYARESLSLLNDVVRDRFDALLLQSTAKKPLPMKYDLVLKMDTTSVAAEINFGALEKISFITFDNYIRHRVGAILRTGLGPRVTVMSVEANVPVGWSISKRKPASVPTEYTISLQLNPDEASKQVTKGPTSGDSEESQAKFRGFWGNMASLRRFKDGTIQHCVVWKAVKDEPVISSIIRYVLDAHVARGLGDHVSVIGYDVLQQLPVATTVGGGSWSSLKSSFDDLARAVVGLDLPLRVKSVLPASTGLRQTSVLEPVPFAIASPDYWNEAIVQFEYTTKLPDEISALERTKTALLLKMLAMLEETGNWRGAMVEDSVSVPFVTQHVLQVASVSGGFGFQLRVVTERDETMYLRAAATGGASLKHVLQNTYLKFYRQAMARVKHTRTIGTLAPQFPAFSDAVRLVKRWFDAHMLLVHFGDELVELLVLKVFTDSAPFSTPNSAPSAFLQVLNFLASWNWKEAPLILDLVKDANDREDGMSDRLTVHSYKVIEENFRKIRASDPSAIKTQLFVGSKDDPSGILWSHDVSLPMASRMTALARAALSSSVSGVVPSSAFEPVLGDYDFVLHLNSSSVASTAASGVMTAYKFKNLSNIPQHLPGDFSDAQDLHWLLYEQLERSFGQVVMFSTPKFTAAGGAHVVTGIFVPAYLGKRKFKPNLGFDTKPYGQDEVVLNKQGVLEQIKRLGGSLVKKMDVKK